MIRKVCGKGGAERASEELRNIYIQLLDKLRKDEPLALVTIVETKGSAPQIPGASALFSSEVTR